MKKVILWFTLLISLQIIVTYLLDFLGGEYNVTNYVPEWYNIIYFTVFLILFIGSLILLIGKNKEKPVNEKH